MSRMRLRLAASGLLLGGLPLVPALGHICGEREIVMRLGDIATYTIMTDVTEDEPTFYDFVGMQVDPIPDPGGGDPEEAPDPVAVFAYPDIPFTAFSKGDFYIEGIEVGSATLSFFWRYEPFEAEGVCVVDVIVLPPANAPPGTGTNYGFSAKSGDPVNLFTGELIHVEEPDIFLGGPMPLFFQRYYASGLTRDALVESRLGRNWMHNFDLRMARTDKRIDVAFEQGRRIRFGRNESVWRLVDGHIPFQLHETEEGDFTLADPRDKRMYTFNPNGLLVAIDDANGNRHTLTYEGLLLSEVSDKLGRTLTFTYAGFRELNTVSDGTRTIKFSHYPPGGLNTLERAHSPGGQTGYAYDGGALLTSITLPEENIHYQHEYSDEGRVIGQTDAYGNAWTYAYADEDGMFVTTETDPKGHVTVYRHDASGRLVDRTDPDEATYSLKYNEDGRIQRVADRTGEETHFDYDMKSGRDAVVVEPDGATTQVEYTSREAGNHVFRDIAAIEFSDGRSVGFTRDENGNTLFETDEAGHVWTYTYNQRGQELSATNPNGGVTVLTYNADATPASVQDPAGNVTVYAYDDLRRLSGIEHPDGTGVSFAYDAQDQLVSVIDEAGESWVADYDANGNLVSLAGPGGKTYGYTYDDMDRLVTIVDPLGQVSTYAYDSLGRMREFTGPDENPVAFGYDSRGWFASLRDAAGGTLDVEYDSEGLPGAISDPLGEIRFLERNAQGRVTRFTDAASGVTDLEYDLRGRLTGLVDPLGRRTTYSYDERGLISKMTLPGGLSTSFSRDAVGALTQVLDPRGSAWELGRDAMGRLVSLADPAGNTIAYAYNENSGVSTIRLPDEMGMADIAYGPTGDITGISYSDGVELEFTYDSNRWFAGGDGIILERDSTGRITETNGIEITRDSRGRIASMTVPGGTIEYAYNMRGRLAAVEDWMGGRTEFAYDAALRLVSIKRPNGLETHYDYDAENRILGIEEKVSDNGSVLASTALERNSAGNIIRRNRKGPFDDGFVAGREEWSYDAASRVEQFDYDAIGRRIADDIRTYEWDLASRLRGYAQNGDTVGFTYDAFGNRLTREAPGDATRSYTWNFALGITSVSVELESNAFLRYYVHTPGGALLYSIEAGDGDRRFYHYDEAGNTLLLTDDSGVIVASYTYGEYGEVLAANEGVDNLFTFQGMYGIMRETNRLFAVHDRYYDARMGRFLSRDPVFFTDPKGINPYQYALGNPLGFVDATGSQPVGTPEWFQERIQESRDRSERLEGDLEQDIREGRSDVLIRRMRRSIENEREWERRWEEELEELRERERQRRDRARDRHLARRPVKETPEKTKELTAEPEPETPGGPPIPRGATPGAPESPVSISPTGQATDSHSGGREPRTRGEVVTDTLRNAGETVAKNRTRPRTRSGAGGSRLAGGGTAAGGAFIDAGAKGAVIVGEAIVSRHYRRKMEQELLGETYTGEYTMAWTREYPRLARFLGFGD